MKTLVNEKSNYDFQKNGLHEVDHFGQVDSLQELSDYDALEINGGLHPAVIVGGIIVVGVCVGLGVAYLTREKK
ncbi:hypothetical protein [Mongoliitalea daihaiensis]|uniref:hypothetical protein n=1 Tax=Mongoliitalea daihaiensis TaxID=2782006 RepID=UPI001F3310A1|nr:hypothetical protein [Mongoliitalea daihaiensis]UJP66780.1 hypothetical protein IPZ59_09415 [Mongoliitalea daihaiensis]